MNVELALLNGFRLTINGEPRRVGAGSQRVLAAVALREVPSPRSRIAYMLWPDASEARACGNMRSTLWRLRKECCEALDVGHDFCSLEPGIAVDVRRVTALAQCLLDGGEVAAASSTVRDLLSGELLPDWYEDWVIVERERLRHLSLHSAEALCHRMIGAGKYSEAIEAAFIGIRQEPLRESFRRLLVQTLIAEGNYAEALRQFDEYRALLRDELNLDPSPHIMALVNSLSGAQEAATR